MNTASVDMIVVKEGNRKNGKLEPLTSVKDMGIRIPLVVYIDKEDPNHLHLVDGHRRLFTAKKLGMTEVPITIIPQEEAETTYALANLDREDLCPLDIYEMAKKLQYIGKSNEAISATLKMSKYQLNRYLKLDNLTPSCLNSFKKGEISWEVASELASYPQEVQETVSKLKWALRDAKSVREQANLCVGVPLKAFNKDFLEDSLGESLYCLRCPKNRAADLTLFGEATISESVCTNPECLLKKLKGYAIEHGCDDGLLSSEYYSKAWYSDMGENIASKDWSSYSEGEPNPDYEDQKKYLFCLYLY